MHAVITDNARQYRCHILHALPILCSLYFLTDYCYKQQLDIIVAPYAAEKCSIQHLLSYHLDPLKDALKYWALC